MTTDGTKVGVEAEPVPPPHVLEALRLLNAALEADPSAMHALLAHHIRCAESVPIYDTVRVRGDSRAYSVSPLGLVWACVGRVPSGKWEGFPWLDVDTDSRLRPVRFRLCTTPPLTGVQFLEVDFPEAKTP